MENPDMDMEALMADAKPADEEETSEQRIRKALKRGDADMCCCCLCQCSDRRTRPYSCCCFFPIKCGIYSIGGFIVALTFAQFLEVFYQLLNDDIVWWYVFVGVLLTVPLIVSCMFTVTFFAKDTDDSRTRLRTACIMAIISVTLLACWNTLYFLAWYKVPLVRTGNDGIGFTTQTRKQEVVFSLYIAAVIDALFAYFICVVQRYIEALEEPKPEDAMMMMDGEKKEEEKKDGDAAAAE